MAADDANRQRSKELELAHEQERFASRASELRSAMEQRKQQRAQPSQSRESAVAATAGAAVKTEPSAGRGDDDSDDDSDIDSDDLEAFEAAQTGGWRAKSII